jgi:hypothetical protein
LPFVGLTMNGNELLNMAALGLISCIAAYLLMFLFYVAAYQPAQLLNTQQMKNFLVTYLSDINDSFRKSQNESTSSIVDIRDHVKTDIVLWVTNLQWMAFRAFFIECFLRNVCFQIRRNSIYALAFVPVLFGITLIITTYLFHIAEFKIVEGKAISPQIGFYSVLGLLLVGYYHYLKEAFPSLEGFVSGEGDRGWYGFHKLNLLNAITKVMESYADSLISWRSKFGGGGLGG